jgi:nucleoside 2-deoxyribosyltransferase
MKPLVYIAGPITLPEPMENVNRAVKVASRLRDSGLVVPFVPHTTCIWHMIEPADYEAWLAYDFDIIRHCDALLRIDGESKGADREVEFARSFDVDIAVFFDEGELLQWAGWRAAS